MVDWAPVTIKRKKVSQSFDRAPLGRELKDIVLVTYVASLSGDFVERPRSSRTALKMFWL